MSHSDLEEKSHEDQVEHIQSVDSNDARIAQFTLAQQKEIIRHVDRRLVVTLGLLYCTSLMDRSNLGSAAIAGMLEDLELTVGNRYTLISIIFFIPYVLFQPPATVVLRKLGPRNFLSAIVMFWGATVIGFGFAPDWNVMMGLRAILGVLEAGFFPGCAYLLSTWYPRYELQKRNAVFYLIGSMASAFSGILAYGFMQMDGLSGLAGWRWILIMEGVITCLASLVGYLMVVDFPEFASRSWRFLTPAESEFMVARIEKDRHDTVLEPFQLGAYLRNGLDLKVWGFAWLFMLATTTSIAIAYFLPIILRDGMKFDIARAQCLVAPPYVAAALIMYAEAVLGDRWHLRGPFVAFNSCLGLIGLPLLGFATNNGVRYFGAFLATICGNANVPAILTYQANNIRGQWKRAFCSATLVGFGGLGGIIGSTVFREADSPSYRPGIMAAIIANGISITIVVALTFKFWRANRRAAAGGDIIEHQAGFYYTY